jgi:hypothetical protein
MAVPGAPVTHTVADGHMAMVARPARAPEPQVEWKQQPTRTHFVESVVAAGDAALLARGLHEYELLAPDDGANPLGVQALALTIVRAVGWLSRDDIQGRPGHAGPELATPGAQCIGPMEVEYALAPLVPGTTQAAVARLGRRFGAPPLVLEALDPEYRGHSGYEARARDIDIDQGAGDTYGHAQRPDNPAGFARVNAHGIALEGLELSALKLADDDSGEVVVRGFNPGEAPVDAVLVVPPGVVVAPTRIDETPLDSGYQPAGAGGRVTTHVPVGGIATWRIRM